MTAQQTYYSKNKDKISERMHNYYIDNKAKISARVKNYQLVNLDKKQSWRQTFRLKKYNLTQALYDELLEKQNNQCAICFQTFTKTPDIDHNHLTNKVRGLLCHRCNMVIRDDLAIMKSAIKYLEKNLI